VAAVVGVLSVGVLMGVVVGVALSLGWLVYVATRPPMPELGREPGTGVFRELDEHPDDQTVDGAAVVRLDGGLFFATVEALEDRVRALLDRRPDVRTLVLDLKSVPFIDSQGAEGVHQLQQLTASSGVVLRLAHAKPQVLSVLRLDGLLDEIGADRVHGNVEQALDAHVRGRVDV
jgi:anti-anti-sigma factor